MRLTRRTLVPLRQSAALSRKRPDRSWAVYYPGPLVDGRQEVARRFFRVKSEAEAFCALKEAEIARLGVLANGLSDELKREALACSGRLAPLGRSLTEAVEWFIKTQPAKGAPTSLEEACKVLQQRIVADGYSKRHSQNVGQIVGAFAREGSRPPLQMITSEEIQAWLDSKRTREGEPLTAVAFNTYRRYLSLFFMFCLKRGWVSSNPLMRVNARKVSSKVPRLLSPDDLKGILDACPEEMKPVLAIQAFCGVRVAESARLTWSDLIETKAGCYVQIGADSAKTSRRRLTPVPEGVAAYLRSVRKPAGYVYPAGRGNVNVLQKAIQHFRQSLRQVAWGRNALRASALSYRLALTKDAAATALEMGNSATILMRDYRELTTPAVAKDWFSVSPA